jgi:hypothetical protein
MHMKRIALFLGFSMLLGLSSAYSAEVPDEQFLYTYKTVFNKVKAPDHWFGVWFSDKPNYPSIPALNSGTPGGETIACNSINDANCKNFNSFGFVANYPFCSTLQITDCIENVFAIGDNQKKISASSVVYLPKNPLSINTGSNYHPGGSSKEIFDLPGVVHKGGSTKYAVEVMMMGGFNIFDRSQSNSGASYSDNSFFVNITPVNMKSGNYEIPGPVSPSGQWTEPAKFDRNCVVLDVDQCGMAQAFPSGYKFGVTIRMATRIYGWLQGRVQEPIFTSEDIPTGKKITVSGYPMVVPSIAGGGDYESKLTPALQKRYRDAYLNNPYAYFDNFTSDRGTTSLDAFAEWAPVLGDKATVMPSVWSFRNIKKEEFKVIGLNAGRCIVSAMKTGIGGMVATNATAYSSGPPTFNESTQSLDYKVAAPHFTSKGDVFRGYYNLKIRSETARCIYNFKPVPLQATISIVSEGGEKVVGTTTVRSDDEWIELTAANFGFSTPTLRVKLTEGDAPIKLDKVTVAKKLTITCTKGKNAKIITGTNPTCPSGYKKKP